ncbi:MAG: hypothetical protein WDO56_27080 [Gammaproteobacteria bacterium]
MPDRLLAPAAVATLLCLTTTVVTAQTPSTMSAEQGWSSIARCAQADSERARHTCLDRVLRDAGLLTPEMHAQQQRRAFGLDDKPANAPPPAPEAAAKTARTATAAAAGVAESPTPAALPTGSATRKTVAPSLATAAPPAQPDRLEVELASVARAPDGKLFVTTTDGAVWLQNESVDMPQVPVAGDRMTIRKGSMGGYRCSVVSTHLTYRCVRNR